MSQNKNSPLQGEEKKTVSGGEEQSSQTSSWWPLVLIALCAVTTTLDKRNPHPSTVPTELQDKQTKRGQTESSDSDKGHVWDKWNPQTWGNLSLVVMQGGFYSAFQIADSSDGWGGNVWGTGACFLIAQVGIAGFFLALKTNGSRGLIWVTVLQSIYTSGGLSGWGGLSTGWVIFFQISSLVAAWRASDCLNEPSQKGLKKGAGNG